MRLKYQNLLHSRCYTCKHWDGDRKRVEQEVHYKLIDMPNALERYLNIEHIFGEAGTCQKLYSELKLTDVDGEIPMVLGTFGCIFHQKIEQSDA